MQKTREIRPSAAAGVYISQKVQKKRDIKIAVYFYSYLVTLLFRGKTEHIGPSV